MRLALDRSLRDARERVRRLGRSRLLADPGRIVRDRRALLDAECRRLGRLSAAVLARARERLEASAARLESASPLHLLARGWSLTSREGAAAGLRSIAGIVPGELLLTRLFDGEIASRVTALTPRGLPSGPGEIKAPS